MVIINSFCNLKKLSININLVKKVEKWTHRNVFISFSKLFDQIGID